MDNVKPIQTRLEMKDGKRKGESGGNTRRKSEALGPSFETVGAIALG